MTAVPITIGRSSDDARSTLRSDCSQCFGLCCVALAFERSSDFAATKRAGTPCRNLSADDRCSIHDRLRDSGFRGCTVYECFGAGQQVSQRTFAGISWREAPEHRATMFAVFPIVRALQELRWYLAEARQHARERAVISRIDAQTAGLAKAVGGTPEDLLGIDLDTVRRDVGDILRQVEVRVASAARPRDAARVDDRCRPGADLVGATLRGLDLRGAPLRGALLIAADLRGADLSGATLLGADLRDTRLEGARLAGALFLTQPQVNAARGDATTALPAAIDRPASWR